MCQTQSHEGISQVGGWCENSLDSQHETDKPLAMIMADLFAGHTVVGLGDGLGKYRELLLQTGKITGYDAFDGTPSIASVTNGSVS